MKYIRGENNNENLNQEDRTEAVRRHRANKKTIAEAIDRETNLRDILRQIGFIDISWDDFIEIMEGCRKNEDGEWYSKDGKRIYPPQVVFFCMNTMIMR